MNNRTRRPLQFGLGTLMAAMLAACALFAGLKWLGVSPFGRALILGIVVVSAAAGAGLLVAIANASDDR